mmetsp:Transcript_146583/g.365527  ORF Transcript_146583/g.365527 Transcript_146583/m.365527 type:complete len:306 (-) Transcript_146583:201-1118(-)|eukprot:CAMPEP_0115710104 /NCGR_PEP_ID=MMETSP0272-20121206/72837_1 /TAXON_ID=71861 /ORGANISM="Scrippsiella trochoidea, Strain CCMP3099" /LENGTH=305 /DNA_ID=CAMNT_0003151779 /DNA_START=1 /DNA_END=918 /DNA_ORIENTATION=+
MWRLQVSLVSGRQATIEICHSATIKELQEEICKVLEVPVPEQRLLRSGRWLKAPGREEQWSCTLAEAELEDGATLDVVRVKWVPPTLPPCFHVRLTSTRDRLGQRSYSSAFMIRCDVFADIPAGQVKVEFWRKNDHDVEEYDFKEGTHTTHDQHWMAGTTTRTKKLEITTPLPELLQSWLESLMPVQEEEAFWKAASKGETQEELSETGVSEEWYARQSGTNSTSTSAAGRPVPVRRPGWFVRPPDGCTELAADLRLDRARAITRLLVDEEGMPLRVALTNESANHPMWDKVEEYDVAFDLAAAS